MATARKKVASQKSTSESKALSSVEQQLLARVQSQTEMIKSDGSNIIRVTGKGFDYQGSDLGMTMEVVILGSVFENVYYDAPYDPDSGPVDPLCWAIGNDTRTMGPKKELKTQIGNLCDKCPNNEFGSALTGRGKACRNGRRVAVVPWNSEDARPDLSEIAVLRLAPTSLQNYAKYVNKVFRHLNQDPIQLVTEFSIDQSEQYGKIKIPQVVETISDRAMVADMLALPAEITLNDVPYSLEPTPSEKPKKRAARRSRV